MADTDDGAPMMANTDDGASMMAINTRRDGAYEVSVHVDQPFGSSGPWRIERADLEAAITAVDFTKMWVRTWQVKDMGEIYVRQLLALVRLPNMTQLTVAEGSLRESMPLLGWDSMVINEEATEVLHLWALYYVADYQMPVQ